MHAETQNETHTRHGLGDMEGCGWGVCVCVCTGNVWCWEKSKFIRTGDTLNAFTMRDVCITCVYARTGKTHTYHTHICTQVFHIFRDTEIRTHRDTHTQPAVRNYSGTKSVRAVVSLRHALHRFVSDKFVVYAFRKIEKYSTLQLACARASPSQARTRRKIAPT